MKAELYPGQTDRIWLDVLLIFFLGLAVRGTILSFSPAPEVHQWSVEPINIALSLLRHGTFAAAFSSPDTGSTGVTAHCMPLFPLLAAIVIRIFGYGSAAMRALSWIGGIAASLGFALLPVLGRSCGLDRRIGISAGLLGALVPLNFYGQMNGMFEAPFTFLALIWLAIVGARHWLSAQFTIKNGSSFGLAAASATYFSPNSLVILALCFVCAFIWFSENRIAIIKYFAVAFLIVAAALAPWAIRNRIQMGTLILTRSNFGLELQISNNDYATTSEELNEQNTKWSAQHPYSDREQRLQYMRMGEVAYYNAKLQQAILWIRSHPRQFTLLSLGRIKQFWFPRMHRFPQTIAMDLLTILAVAGLIRLWRNSPAVALFLAITVVGYSLVYVVIEVAMRYRFPVEGFLLLLGAYRVCAWLPVGASRLNKHGPAL